MAKEIFDPNQIEEYETLEAMQPDDPLAEEYFEYMRIDMVPPLEAEIVHEEHSSSVEHAGDVVSSLHHEQSDGEQEIRMGDKDVMDALLDEIARLKKYIGTLEERITKLEQIDNDQY